MISRKYKVKWKTKRTWVVLIQIPRSLRIHSNGREVEKIFHTAGGAAASSCRPGNSRWEDAVQRSRVPAFTTPVIACSSFHVTPILGGDWSAPGTWAGAGRGGAGQSGRRGGAGGGAGGGCFGAGAVGSRQINMESIFHEKVSVRVLGVPV